ncbi:cytochrome P460 family protein [Loktanella sp. Alg231-35]|uniref:cytochrome P460 family protein n=1 Tax=Loktanella sp. Alg231-35 TaxID=1922220 RepID=UPI000D55867C|nr:cytochrome P460 family protein [Loktanella sp. Alg231-35]
MKKFVFVAGVVVASSVFAQDTMMFGSDDDEAYALAIWDSMLESDLAGDGLVISYPYPGTDPHGFLLETFYTQATINGHTGALVVKRNYGPLDVSEDEVIADPKGHLSAITIMFEREAGYDDATQNWFYAKYLPEGSLDVNPNGVSLAGLVGKDADAGCIACHQNASGDDYIFTTDARLTVN